MTSADRELLEAWRAVANAKLAEYRRQCWRLAILVRQGIVGRVARADVRAEHLDGSTPLDDRTAILARLASGETKVVTNCMVLTEGFDCPDIGCCILARPTKKMGLFRQMIGRVLRPADGKPDAIVLDHSGTVFRHGLPEDYVAWSLDPDKHASTPEHQKRLSEKRHGGLLECSQCSALRLGGQPCPACGFMPRRPAEFMATAEGDLGLVQGGIAAAPTAEERSGFYRELRAVAQIRGYKDGWTAHKFKDRFGQFPPWDYRQLQPEAPSDATFRWVKSRQIAFAKAQAKAAS
jgi:superfamily II DNA or RNA helicase